MKRVLGTFGAVLLVGSAALGHEGATGIVKQRMDEMEHVGRVVKRINERLKSKRGLADIARDAEEIRAAATRMPVLVPAGKPGRSLRGERLCGRGGRSSKPLPGRWWMNPRSWPALPGPGRNPPSQRSSAP